MKDDFELKRFREELGLWYQIACLGIFLLNITIVGICTFLISLIIKEGGTNLTTYVLIGLICIQYISLRLDLLIGIKTELDFGSIHIGYKILKHTDLISIPFCILTSIAVIYLRM